MDATTHGRPESLTYSFGQRDTFQLEFQWRESNSENVHVATEAEILAWVRGKLVWGVQDENGEFSPVIWPLVDLLEFLSHRWPWLKYEERYPVEPGPDVPSDIWRTTKDRWDRQGYSEKEEEEVIRFQGTHELSQAFPGLIIPNIWLLRQGEEVVVDSGNDNIAYPNADELFSSFEQIGELIVEQVEQVGDEHAREVIERWEQRKGTAKAQGEIFTGLSGDTIQPLWTFSSNQPENEELEEDEYFTAARQLNRHTTVEELSHIAELISRIESRRTPQLDALSEHLKATDFWQSSQAHTEGYELARWLRDQLVDEHSDFEHRSRFNPSDRLEDWNVEILEYDLEVEELDAVAVWGPAHGPGIILNTSGKHAQQERGRRSTLAHEICHLLVDRSSALPLAEVLGGSVPNYVEKRARAFAAELLLPREIAGSRAISAHENDRPPQKWLKNICNYYGVSHDIAAWQVHNSEQWNELPRQWYKELKWKVPNPATFSPPGARRY